MTIPYLIIGLVVTALIPLSLLFFGIFVAKITDEQYCIKNDKELKRLKYEMDNEDNDGWSKLHYKHLYEKRKKQLKENFNTSK